MKKKQQEKQSFRNCKKNILALITILLLVFVSMKTAGAASGSIQSERMEVMGKTVNVVTIDANNPNVRFDVAKGKDQRVGWESFQSILDRNQPIAAINGNYFDAYADDESAIVPWGYIIKDGEMINSGATINRGSFAVTFDGEIIIDRGEAFSKENIETMIEAGPLLMKDGIIVYDPDSGQFTQDRINRNPAQRSAIGFRPNGQVVMVTGSGIRMTELAEVMKSLGCYAATNLDGGASSALYANGKMLTSPGRKLNTVLTVYDDSDAIGSSGAASYADQIQVMVNNKPLDMEVAPVVINGRTLVPLRAIFEELQVELEWNSETRTAFATTEDAEIGLSIGQAEATVNGVSIPLEAPGTIIEGRTMVSVRFIAESLGAEVDWIAETRTVVIEMSHE
ncbi:stalk domain-containing protein [Tindallia californiensis]|uniref:Exopolysaccharide biosynthesis protein n=1 Tax=Tindallia californiensis TaxID=159292 RepID=A0A1H3KGX3_9FIRM|nr:phosphodiester glycosidase family protein [Tindallia californiensis]SDY51279.1 Exopolysaccharide biosynthesis protein [Tindallia californiensis]